MMKKTYFLDTNIFIYLFYPEVDSQKHKSVVSLFESALRGEKVFWINEWIVAEIVWFLGKRRPWKEVQETILESLLKTKGLDVKNKEVIQSIMTNAKKLSDFVDLMNVSILKNSKYKYIYSYDHGFDKHKSIKRLEP